MKKPAHYVKPKHRTCATPSNRRRSPVAGPSYDADIALLDEYTGNTLYRRHRDGTKVIYNEIFSNETNCMYSDKSITIKERITRLWNDVYAENKSDKERIALYGEINIPYCFNDEQSIEFAKRVGEYFATTYNRICQISIHKKKNLCHIHFNLTEREYKEGKFLQKRKKIYKDMNGNLIYDKQYKDSRGWDIRKPIIDTDKVPTGDDPYRRNPETGKYLYQKLGERNKKQWCSDTSIGKWFEEEQTTKLHDDIDEIANQYLLECGYNVTISRTPKTVAKMLKELDIEQIRIPTKDYKTNSSAVAEIKEKNKRNKILRDALIENYEKKEQNKQEIFDAKRIETVAMAKAINLMRKKREAEKALVIAEEESQQAEKEYMKALLAYNESLQKKFSFTGTLLDRRRQFALYFNNMKNGISPENDEFLKAVSKERDYHKKIVVDAVFNKLTSNELNEIYNNATEKDKQSDNYAKSYLKRLPKKLKDYANQHGENEKFDIYDDWSKRAKNTHEKIYTQHTKDQQKTLENDRTDRFTLSR